MLLILDISILMKLSVEYIIYECRVTGNQVLYFVGLKYASATVACALTNLLPAFTFVLAILFR
jgi:hypothetical protein